MEKRKPNTGIPRVFCIPGAKVLWAKLRLNAVSASHSTDWSFRGQCVRRCCALSGMSANQNQELHSPDNAAGSDRSATAGKPMNFMGR
ncbi:hypothetical protein T265_08079 [Opisthorchis viverrini]|uniref:Uncharacterized protein n=1 Tax=Opisthorchis viverrini TaxID=6198 RepID=A0A074ZAD8_OPIVI|nr:hypothetical protein T265_08079 [Opisthorchis viverrini]KER24236.1 hypothetical protein T265_08079 [Opisthorchis viverrini]